MIRFFVTLLFFLGVATWAAPTFPELSGRVVDQAELLTPDQEQSLSELSKTIEDNSTAQVVVVTLKSLEGYDISDYGYQLGRYWKIGQKDKNNGLLIIIAPNEHKVRIEVGYGLEGEITDAQANDLILTKMVPRFKQKDVYAGIKDTVDAIKDILSQVNEGRNVKIKEKKTSHTTIFYVSMIIIAALIFQWLEYRKSLIRNTKVNRILNGIFTGGVAGIVSWFFFFLLPVSIIAGIIFFIIGLFLDIRSQRNGDYGSFPFDLGENSTGSISSDTFDVFRGAGGSFGGGGSSVDIGDLLDGLGS